jgi:hypothetical protein
MFAFATLALAFVSTVSAVAIPRDHSDVLSRGYKADADILEDYDTYHARYMALSCQTKHNTAFFDDCCHPLLKTEKLSDRPASCTPGAKDAPAPAAPAPAANDGNNDDDDDDLPLCDDGDDGDDNTQPPPAAPKPAAPAPPKAADPPKQAPPQPAPQPKPTPQPAPAPAPKPAAPKPAAPASPAPNTSVNTGGFATFYYQNGNAGACGAFHSDNDLIAAIDGRRYGNLGARSSLCGKQVRITNTKNNKSVVVTIADACPTCVNSNSIDLSVAAFKSIADLSQGLVPISWSFL